MKNNIYDFLANVCSAVHIFVMGFMVSGLFVSKEAHPLFRECHSIIVISMIILNCVFLFHCPLTVLENYLRRINHPDIKLFEPFTVRLLRKTLGISIPNMAITLVILFMGVMAVSTLIVLY